MISGSFIPLQQVSDFGDLFNVKILHYIVVYLTSVTNPTSEPLLKILNTMGSFAIVTKNFPDLYGNNIHLLLRQVVLYVCIPLVIGQ